MNDKLFNPIKSIDEYLKIIKKETSQWFEDEYLWFRGVSDTKYELIPSAYRKDIELVILCGKQYTDDIEYKLFTKFKREAIPYLEIQMNSDWDWYILMQHYGIPTRLLDWTENSLMALFFAIRNSKKDINPAVWVLQPDWLNHLSSGEVDHTIIDCNDKSYENTLKAYLPISKNPLYEKFPENNINHPPLAIIPSISNRLIQTQRGTFTIHKDSGDDIQFWNKKLKYRLFKIEIDIRYRDEIYRKLRNVGIREVTVFPDLYGLARDLKCHFGFSYYDRKKLQEQK